MNLNQVQCSCRKELDATISLPLGKKGPVYPMLKEVLKEALKPLSLAFREFEQPVSWLPLRYFWVVHSVRKLPKQERLLEQVQSLHTPHQRASH